MLFEDFFTLAEIKDGLKSLDRVKELITLMQKENACDASTEWDTVANIIAVTGNKECLDLFVELDGLWFIKRWLNAAHEFGNESGIQDSTIALLRALDKLQIGKSRLVCSGILSSVLELIGHDDSVVHEKAKALCDKWMQKQDDETNSLVAVSSSSCSSDDDNDEEELAQRVVYSSGGDNCKLGVQSEGDSGTGSRFSKPLVEGEGGGGTSMEPDDRMVDLSEPKAMCVNDGETTLVSVSEVAQEPGANTERFFLGFDLNQEGGSEEIEVTTPISVVSASRRIAECGTSSNSKQRSDRLNIDLNVSEDKNTESLIEASAVRLHLDLNSLGDGSVDNVVVNQNGGRSPSQSSSSSIMQPSTRNIDLTLNNNSSFIPNDAFSHHHNLGNLFNNPTESAISLFGTIVDDAIPQPPNGRMLELGLGRSSGGWVVGSSMGVYSFPYMVDPRGGVLPEFVGSSSAQPQAPGEQPPAFFMNMDAGGSQQNVDSNGGNRQVSNDNYHEGQSSWVVGGKRQEPDGGWDDFSGDYKHQQPPWK